MEQSILRSFTLFATLPQAELKYLSGICRRRVVQPGETLFREGDTADSLFLVETGELGAYAKKDGTSLALGSLRSGEIFGEMSFITKRPRSAHVVALMTSHVIEIRFDELERMASLNPSFGMALYKAVALQVCEKTYEYMSWVKSQAA